MKMSFWIIVNCSFQIWVRALLKSKTAESNWRYMNSNCWNKIIENNSKLRFAEKMIKSCKLSLLDCFLFILSCIQNFISVSLIKIFFKVDVKIIFSYKKSESWIRFLYSWNFSHILSSFCYYTVNLLSILYA